MRTVGIAIGSFIGLWVVVRQVLLAKQGRRRRPVVDVLGADPASPLDLPALDLQESIHDRLCFIYWTDDAIAWQYTRRPQVVKVVRLRDVIDWAYDNGDRILALETGDGGRCAWQMGATALPGLLQMLLTTIDRATSPPRARPAL